jgi:hypothetical protein
MRQSYEIFVVAYIEYSGTRGLMVDVADDPHRFGTIDEAYKAGLTLENVVYWDVLTLEQSRDFMRANIQVPVPSGR